jgi:hypothetical protein
MDTAQAIIVERQTHSAAIRLFKQAIRKGLYKPNEFNKFIEDVMQFGLTMEAMIQSKRIDKDVFKKPDDIVVTSKEKLFSDS